MERNTEAQQEEHPFSPAEIPVRKQREQHTAKYVPIRFKPARRKDGRPCTRKRADGRVHFGVCVGHEPACEQKEYRRPANDGRDTNEVVPDLVPKIFGVVRVVDVPERSRVVVDLEELHVRDLMSEYDAEKRVTQLVDGGSEKTRCQTNAVAVAPKPIKTAVDTRNQKPDKKDDAEEIKTLRQNVK